MGRLLYLDPGLRNNSGHHAGWCRGILREARSRGIETRVLTFVGIDPALQAEFSAVPLFRAFTYCSSDGDPISGWLNMYDVASAMTADDLSRLTDLRPDDLVYLIGGRPPQLKGMLHWLRRFPSGCAPRVVFDFAEDPGLDIAAGPNGQAYLSRDPRQDPRAVLYRFTARDLPAIDLSRFHMVTGEQACSAAYSVLLNRAVGVMPIPHPKTEPLHGRAGRRPITVATIGHQRAEKGYHLVPELARRLLGARGNIRMLVHNAEPGESERIQAELRVLAAGNPRLIVDERSLDELQWARLLDACDLIVCPYRLGTYGLMISGIGCEAIANGIPLVVPAGTVIAAKLREFGAGGVIFDEATPEAIIAATEHALDGFDRLAATAHAAAGRWQQTHGPRPFVDALLALAGPA
jgi:glycosyltransferase involved in cell wall biosynthesis